MNTAAMLSNQQQNRLLLAIGRGILLSAVIVVALAGQAEAQQIQVLRVYGSNCVNGDNYFALTGASCSSVSWYASSGGTIISQSSSMCQVRWSSPTSTAYVSAYANSCSGPPYSGSATSPSFVISNPVTPAVSISASATTVCQSASGNVTFTASPTNGGSSPYYSWRVNGTTITSGTGNTFTRAISSLANGDVITAVLSANAPCMSTSTATSNGITMTVTAPAAVTATVSGPQTICSGSSSNASFVVSLTNGGGTPTYAWYKNGFPVSDQLSGPPPYVYVPQNPLNNGDKIKCRVTFSGATCLSPNPVESNEFTVTLTPPTTPYVSIGIPNIYFCEGNTITFTANSQYLTSGSTYSWQMNGSFLSSASSVSMPVATSSAVPGAFNVGDVVTLSVTGLSGTCLSSTTASASTNGIPFQITPLPTATISPSGSVNICSTCTQNITAASGSGYTYQWRLNGADITSGGTVNPYPASTPGTYTVRTSAGSCSRESTSLTLTKNARPVANAGPDKNITLPTNSTTLNGSGTDNDGTIAGYAWTKVSGPAATLTGANTANLALSNLVAGTYVFQLVVTDNFGEASLPDQATITVSYPANNLNWIRETTVFVQNKLNETAVTAALVQNGEKRIDWRYFDNLGRPLQTVVVQGSPLAKDVIAPTVYDATGREHRKYLPVVINQTTGYYASHASIIDNTTGNFTGVAAGFYAPGSDNKIPDDTRPFSETTFEPSPMSRPAKDFGPGNDWFAADKFNGYRYLVNKHGLGNSLTDEKVVAWKITGGLPVRNTAVNAGSGYYASGELGIACKTDENGNETREYKDRQGRVILRKVQAATTVTALNSNTQWTLTYYVYDDFGNLVFVLQPQLCATILGSDTYNPTATDISRFAFQYTYDERQRLVEKKMPGADPVYMVYDNRDRLVLTQDGNQRKDAAGTINKTEWSFIKYDVLNRPVVTGIYTHGSVVSRTTMAGLVSTTNFNETYNGVSATHGYTNTVFPTTGIQVYTVTYYDNYRFRDDLAGAAYNYTTGDINGQEASANAGVKGYTTGMKINVLGTTTYLWSVTYYDQKYRTIQTKTLNTKNGIDRVTNLYDFVKLKEARATHSNGTGTYTSHYKYEYDHAGRAYRTWHKFHTEPAFVLILENEYNEAGNVVTKKIHSRDNGATFGQLVDQRFNIRGWLEKINDPMAGAESGDLFSMELEYSQPSSQGGGAQFNGNVSEMIWRTAGLDRQSYGYTYDPMNRLLAGNYYNRHRPLNNGRYTEKIGDGTLARPAYDLNGNILNLIRYGKNSATGYGMIDNLTYAAYTGNQVTRINEGVADTNFDDGFKGAAVNADNEYTYDWNGNMKKDQNKGLTGIEYNVFNLPSKISRSATEYVTYAYDATGKKITQQVFGTTAKTTDYLADFVYENGILQYFTLPEGRIVPDNSAGAPRPWEYQYFLKDHLGNVRVTFSEKKSGTQYKATLENDRQTIEQAAFRNYSRNGFTLFNHTTGSGYTYAQLLNGGNGSQVGLARSFAVNPGDILDLEVYAKYEAPTSTNTNVTTLLASLTSAFALGSGTGPLESVQAQSAFNSLFPGGGPWITSDKWEDGAAPKAYLNYILFNESFQLVDFGFDQVSVNAQQVGATPVVPHDYLSLHVKVQQKGYLYIYLSNESTVQTNVYFDDLSMVHQTGVVQVNEYYPFGLTYNGYTANGTARQDYKYNGKELQDELNINWYDYQARQYDPATARWMVVDPLADKMRRHSPYNYAFDNPVRYIDPDGMGPQDIILTGEEEAKKAYLAMLHDATGNNYSLDKDNKLVNNGADPNFKGNKSTTLADAIDKGIKSSETYSLDLVGAKGDDHAVFVDSFVKGKIDVSDLTKMGEASKALQGAAIAHFLNEIQSMPGYGKADEKAREAGFNAAHTPSLATEGKVYGELVGDATINTRVDYPTGAAVDGFQTIIWQYNAANQFEVQQGAKSVTKQITVNVGGVQIPANEVTTEPTGQLKSVTKKP